MKKIILSVVFALPAPFVFILGAELFEVRGKASIPEILAGCIACIAVALYLAYCQFWVAPKGSREFGAKWPTLGAMTATLLLWVIYIAFKQKTGTVLVDGIAMLVSGCLGSLAGAVAAGRLGQRPSRKPQGTNTIDRYRSYCRNLLVCAAVLVAVAFGIVIGVIPAVKADISPSATPRGAMAAFWIIATLHVLAGALLALFAWRAPLRNRISTEGIGAPAILALFLAFGLCAPAVAYLHYGPPMRIASVLLFFFASADLATTVLVTTTTVAALAL